MLIQNEWKKHPTNPIFFSQQFIPYLDQFKDIAIGNLLMRKQTKAEFPRWKTSSEGFDTFRGFGEVWKHGSVRGMCETKPKSMLAG
jgi:hypothetical protein